MTRAFSEINVEIKKFIREKNNFIVFLLIMNLAFNIFNYLSVNNNFKLLDDKFTKVRNKIDHRYFNTTTSLQEIHKVKINTYNGEVR